MGEVTGPRRRVGVLSARAFRGHLSEEVERARRSHSDAVDELTRCAVDPQVTAALVGYLYGQRQSGLASQLAGDQTETGQRPGEPGA